MTKMDAEAAHRSLVRQLRALEKRGGDAKLQAYVGSPYPVLGLSVPALRSVIGPFVRTHRSISAADLHRLAALVWKGETYEEKQAGIALLGRYPRLLDDRTWSLVDGWIEEAIGWALSDTLASGPVAEMVYTQARFPELMRWTRARSFWRRRASTYALAVYVRRGELDKPLRLLERLLYDDEFWVQRAVGTWLRECWKKDARRVEAFLRSHAKGLPPVTITVATERASKAFREELRALARRSRAAR